MHTTNYFDTFITIAPDSTATEAAEPPYKEESPSIAWRTWRMIASAPYGHTSDDVIFTVWADRREIPAAERDAARAAFFSKGQACLRSSDLVKRYGWGIHADAEGRVALIGAGTPQYEAFASGAAPDGRAVTVTQGIRSSRAK